MLTKDSDRSMAENGDENSFHCINNNKRKHKTLNVGSEGYVLMNEGTNVDFLLNGRC